MHDELKKKLRDDPRYQEALKKVIDDAEREHVEKTGEAFITFLADGLAQLKESLNDPNIRAEVSRLLRGKKNGQ